MCCASLASLALLIGVCVLTTIYDDKNCYRANILENIEPNEPTLTCTLTLGSRILVCIVYLDDSSMLNREHSSFRILWPTTHYQIISVGLCSSVLEIVVRGKAIFVLVAAGFSFQCMSARTLGPIQTNLCKYHTSVRIES